MSSFTPPKTLVTLACGLGKVRFVCSRKKGAYFFVQSWLRFGGICALATSHLWRQTCHWVRMWDRFLFSFFSFSLWFFSLGFSGIAIHKISKPLSLTLTDYTETILQNITHNVEANGLKAYPTLTQASKERFDFFEYGGTRILSVKCFFSGICVRQLDWRSPVSFTDEDLLVGGVLILFEVRNFFVIQLLFVADITYDKLLIEDLVEVLEMFLSRTECQNPPYAIIVSTIRNLDTYEHFKTHLQKKGITYEQEVAFVPHLILYDRPQQFEILKLQKIQSW